MKIFISVAAYQDPMLLETIGSAYVNAKFPQNLIFGVLDQSDEPLEINKIKFRDQIKFEHIIPLLAKGPCWARRRIQNFITDEKYYLQIDSHTLFQKNWDELLINYHNWCEKSLGKSFVISGYPRSFEILKILHAKENSYKMKIGHKDTLAITFREERIFEDGHYSMQKNVKAGSYSPVKGLLVGGGFIFGRSEFVSQVPYDEMLYFHGEELNIALRLFTNGWAVVHIPRVPLFHQYTDVKTLTRKMHWNPEDELNRKKKWHELDKESKYRLSQIIEGNIQGEYGLGSIRTLEEFSQKCGLDILNKKVIDHDCAINGYWLEEINNKIDFKEIEIKNK